MLSLERKKIFRVGLGCCYRDTNAFCHKHCTSTGTSTCSSLTAPHCPWCPSGLKPALPHSSPLCPLAALHCLRVAVLVGLEVLACVETGRSHGCKEALLWLEIILLALGGPGEQQPFAVGGRQVPGPGWGCPVSLQERRRRDGFCEGLWLLEQQRWSRRLH